MYILCIYVHIYMYTHTNTRVSATHPPGRSLILLRIFGWIEAKGRKWFLFLPLVPIWVTFLLRTKRLAGFSFFFFGTVLFLSCLRLISRVITNGDTRISAAFRFPLEEPLCVIQGRGSYFVIYLYLPVLRKWLENGVPEKNIACSRTPLFRNVFCQTVSKRSFSG